MSDALMISDERLEYLANRFFAHRLDDYGVTFIMYVLHQEAIEFQTGAMGFLPLLDRQRAVMFELGNEIVMHQRFDVPTLTDVVKPGRVCQEVRAINE